VAGKSRQNVSISQPNHTKLKHVHAPQTLVAQSSASSGVKAQKTATEDSAQIIRNQERGEGADRRKPEVTRTLKTTTRARHLAPQHREKSRLRSMQCRGRERGKNQKWGERIVRSRLVRWKVGRGHRGKEGGLGAYGERRRGAARWGGVWDKNYFGMGWLRKEQKENDEEKGETPRRGRLGKTRH